MANYSFKMNALQFKIKIQTSFCFNCYLVSVCKCARGGHGWSGWIKADWESRPDSLNNQSITHTAKTKQLATNQSSLHA